MKRISAFALFMPSRGYLTERAYDGTGRRIRKLWVRDRLGGPVRSPKRQRGMDDAWLSTLACASGSLAATFRYPPSLSRTRKRLTNSGELDGIEHYCNDGHKQIEMREWATDGYGNRALIAWIGLNRARPDVDTMLSGLDELSREAFGDAGLADVAESVFEDETLPF